MDEQKNTPVVMAAQAVAVLAEQRGSLVRRGLMAIQNSKKLAATNDREAWIARMKAMIVLSKERGYLTYTEINDHLPDMLEVEQVEEVVSMINDMGITVCDVAPDGDQESKKSEIICNSQDERYRQARVIFNRGIEIGKLRWTEMDSRISVSFGMARRPWNEKENPDLFSAFKAFQQLADENYGKTYYPLYCLCRTRLDTEGSHNHIQHLAQLAFDWCFANQSSQDAESWCDLGEMYLDRDDKQAAVYWFRKAADQGHAAAQYYLGILYTFGHGVPQDYKEAVKWYRLAADQGYAAAQYNLGILYTFGHGVPQDQIEAMKWYRLAADQGHAGAQYSFGRVYYHKERASQDYKEAMKWFRLVADQGYAAAQYYLGSMYGHGDGVPQDYKEAMKWYRLAADQGYAAAQYNIGYMYDHGDGVPQDQKEAVKWYRLAAVQGDADAQRSLGYMGLM